MFYTQAEHEDQVGQYLLQGFTITEAQAMSWRDEQIAADEYRRWCDEMDSLETVE